MIKPQNVRRCIVKGSLLIRDLLEQRFTELELSGRQIIADAVKHNYHAIKESTLSRYRRSGNVKGSLPQEDIIWLCYRYGVEFNLSAKLKEYSEKECLKTLKKNW